MKNETALIPRSILFGNPDTATPTVSPDGSRIAYLAPRDGVLNVWVAARDEFEKAVPVTHDTERGIRMYSWTHTGDHIVYIQDKKGDENWHLYAVEITTHETRDLTPLEGVHAHIQHVSPNFPDDILVAMNDRDPSLHDVYRVAIKTGERELLQRNDGMTGFVTDDEYTVRFASRVTADGGSEILAPNGSGEWDVFLEIGKDDALTTDLVGFDKSGDRVYLLDSRGRDTSALTIMDLPTQEQTLLCDSDRADIDGVIVHPTEKTVQAASYSFDRKAWIVLDDSIRDDLSALSEVSAGEISIMSRSLDDAYWTVAYLVDDGPTRYYLYDRSTKSARFLCSNRKDLETQPLVPMFAAVLKARDGLDLVAYITLPGATASGDDRTSIPTPETPLPAVLLVHGGPWARDTWGYDPMHQWLANRGYAVISVNFRASTGFGKAFINAGNKEWGAAMHRDLLDTVEWAVENRIADRSRIAIMGGSYGGYATLAALTLTPEVFACGVDIVGPSNLITLLESVPEYWKPMLELLTTRVGDHRTDEGREFLKSCSPLTYADRIVRPLLIGQGANDPRVKRAESDQIVEAMARNGIPVTYVIYPDEGHGFARPENRLSFFAIAEGFLSKTLGGRFEEIGDAFTGSTAEVAVGADDVPGLAEALSGGRDTV
ncbi:MAG: S9 family peptidase [Spirochaetaceae bacterium]|nr:MAG: S9 family peptidase [Spirochaetaceae bacterium]